MSLPATSEQVTDPFIKADACSGVTIVVHSPDKIGRYILKSKIGEGGFSSIRIAVDTVTGAKFACKVVPKKRLYEKNMDAFLEREVRILEQLEHPSVIRFFDILQDSLNYYIIMELCNSPTLFDFIVSRGKLDEKTAKCIFREICGAVRYVHEMGIAHRDIKPENILVRDDLKIVLIDFGLSEYCDQMITSSGGSCGYQCPESLRKGSFDGIKGDIWSLGVVLFTMMFGHLPWTRRTRQELLQQIRECQFFVPVSIPEECRELILGMMNPDVNDRWTIDMVLNSRWLRGVEESPCRERARTIRPRISVDGFFTLSSKEVKTSSSTREAKELLVKSRRHLPARAILGAQLFKSRHVSSGIM